MRCNECQEALSAYYDEVLDEKNTAEVKAHLRECESCKQMYNQLEMILGSLKEDEEEIVVPPLLHKQMLEKIEKEGQKNKVRHLWPQRVGSLVAAVLVGVILIRVNPGDIGLTSGSGKESSLLTQQSMDESAVQTPEVAMASETGSIKNEEDAEKSRGVLEEQRGEEAQQVIPIVEGNDVESNIRESTQNRTDEMTSGVPDMANMRSIDNYQTWEIKTPYIEQLTTYLEAYVETVGAQIKIPQEEGEVVLLLGITDTQALFEDLQKQSFTESIITVEETGENIKIIVKG